MPEHDHVGHRFLEWTHYDEPNLGAEAKARGYEAFAAEFDSLPPHQEPIDGWAATMADLCRRIARRHRGQSVNG